MKKIGMYLMSHKGYSSLESLLEKGFGDMVAFVVIGSDENVEKDYADEIYSICKKAKIKSFTRKAHGELPYANTIIAISWRWLISTAENQKLIVLHDSLLPKYRGFAPLVNALINGDNEIGVTAIYASEEYDTGDIIAQSSLQVDYPIKINKAIKSISKCYSSIVCDVFQRIKDNIDIVGVPQDESKATYSLWRNEDDYLIDWNDDALRIQRFVDAVGFPYKGASTFVGKEKIRVLRTELVPDLEIENRASGKIILVKNKKPIVVCGKGLLKIVEARYDGNNQPAIPFKKFRIRFHS